MTAIKARGFVVAFFALALSGAYCGSRLLARIDDVLGPSRSISTVEAPGWASVFDMPAEDWVAIAVAIVTIVASNCIAIDALLGTDRMSARVIGLSGAVISGHLALSAAIAIHLQPAVLVQVAAVCGCILIERALRRRVDGLMSSTLAVFPIMLVNVYCGIFLDRTDITVGSVVAIVVIVALYSCMRFAPTLFPHGRESRVVVAVIGIAAAALIFSGSFREYLEDGQVATFAPIDEPWRSLYFSIVLASYATIALPHLPAADVVLRARLTAPFWFAAVMSIAIPALVCFTPHGIVLALGSAVWLLIALFMRWNSLAPPATLRVRTAIGSTLMLLGLLTLLVFDRLAYASTLLSLSPLVIWAVACGPFVVTVLGVVATLITVRQGAVVISRQWIAARLWNLVRRPETLVVLASTLLFVVCLTVYVTAVYARDLRGITVTSLPAFEGFVGVYATSWAAVAYALNVVIVGGYLGYRALQRARADADEKAHAIR